MGRSKDKLEGAVAHLKSDGVAHASYVVGDVRKGVCGRVSLFFGALNALAVEDAQAAISAVLSLHGKLDVLVNNAAGNFLCLAEDISLNAFKSVVDIDLVGTFNMSKAALKALANTKGTIINITATLHYGATQYVLHASAAKAGVDAVTRGLAIEWLEYGIRVNGIAPGPIKETVGMDRLGPLSAGSELPIRMGEKDEIALTAVFLCTRAAGNINGETIVVDGGHWMFRPVLPKDIYQRTIRKQSKL